MKTTRLIETPSPAAEDSLAQISRLGRDRLARSKAAYTTRRVKLETAAHLLQGGLSPRAGDLLLARIEAIGQHPRIELANGRRAGLHVGDEVVVCYGARYAPDQFEAYVPSDLGGCDLVAAGGIAAKCKTRHARMKKPSAIQPLGLLADAAGGRLNLAAWALPPVSGSAHRPYTIAVVGTAMNAGKTTTAASLIRGFKRDGRRVGAAKVTGTGAGGDRWTMVDAGADRVFDFTDAGVPSTFGLAPVHVQTIFGTLTAHLAAGGAEVIVLELADGLYQDETASLLASTILREAVDGIVFVAREALGAAAGVDLLRRQGLPVVAVSGVLTASPLAIRETEQAVGLPVVTAQDLDSASWLPVHDRQVVRLDEFLLASSGQAHAPLAAGRQVAQEERVAIEIAG